MSNIFEYNILGKDKDEEIDDGYQTKIVSDVESFIQDSNENFGVNYDDESKRVEHVLSIIAKIIETHKLAQEGKLTKNTYKRLKKEMFDLLAGYFGCHEDVQRLDETVNMLQKHEILPPNSYDSFLRLTPLSRWM